QGGLAESILAMQVILEGLGEAVLSEIDAALSARGLGFEKLRRVLLRQEAAHHAGGVGWLTKMRVNGLLCTQVLYVQASEYLALSEQVTCEFSGLFEFFDSEPEAYKKQVMLGLPTWLRTAE